MILTQARSAYEKLLIGFRNSTGSIVTFLEDDDKYIKERLNDIYVFFKTHKKVCYYHNDHSVISSDSRNFVPNNKKRRLENRFIIIHNEPDSDVSLKNIFKIKKMRGDFNISSITVYKC